LKAAERFEFGPYSIRELHQNFPYQQRKIIKHVIGDVGNISLKVKLKVEV